MNPERFEFSAGKCLHVARGQTDRRDVENTLERTSVMAPKGVSLVLATYSAAGHSNVTNCAKKNMYAGYKYALHSR